MTVKREKQTVTNEAEVRQADDQAANVELSDADLNARRPETLDEMEQGDDPANTDVSQQR